MELSVWSASLQNACPVTGFSGDLWVLGKGPSVVGSEEGGSLSLLTPRGRNSSSASNNLYDLGRLSVSFEKWA